MRILKDDEIIAARGAVEIHLDNFQWPADPYASDSPIQPSSLDLTIGEIFVPPERVEPGCLLRSEALEDYSLSQGQTALVYTQEVIKLAGKIGAFGFPPASVSSRGLLMTNPGHIDPGFEGKLSFTVINMARDPFHLRKGGKIVTLLLYELSSEAHRDYSARGNLPTRQPNPAPLLRKLSHDFVDVEQRSRKIAVEEIRKAGIYVTLAAALVAVFGAAAGLAGSFGLMQMGERLVRLEEQAKTPEVQDLRKQLEEFEQRLNAVSPP